MTRTPSFEKCCPPVGPAAAFQFIFGRDAFGLPTPVPAWTACFERQRYELAILGIKGWLKDFNVDNSACVRRFTTLFQEGVFAGYCDIVIIFGINSFVFIS